ncbi:hypothetical protein [Streptomyces lydicus]|uniref:hypothetical protein n=1 Tax=Streptomyces lydicus TaxID=47763 RepID=UPI0013E955CD|nr:hypothetical protein [Streptomyces lydicus]MCZ1011889.1 hypothetical protein [Streptomyces lydicus]
MDEGHRRFVLGVIGPVLVGPLVVAAVLLAGRGLSSVRFAVGTVALLCMASA